MIELRDVHKSYRVPSGRKRVLDSVTATFPAGTGIAVLGGNGQGKSTLVRLLAGTESADGGRILRRGRVSFPLGFSGTFHPLLSGRENVRFLARLHGADTRAALAYAEDFAELGEYWRLPVGAYSSGMRARLGFGACLALDFDTYLVDEVIAVGDARFRAKCLEAFRRRAAGAALVLVTHDLSYARAFCTRGAVLHGGRLTFHDTLESAIAAPERAAPAPPRTQLSITTRAIEADNLRRYDDLFSGDYRYIAEPETLLARNGRITVPPRTRASFLARRDMDRRIDVSLRAFDTALMRQQALVDRLSFLSPAILLNEGLTAIAGTDGRRFQRFRSAVSRFHDGWRQLFEPKILGGIALKPKDLAELPRWHWEEPTLAARAWRYMAVMAMLGLIVTLGGVHCLRRYARS